MRRLDQAISSKDVLERRNPRSRVTASRSGAQTPLGGTPAAHVSGGVPGGENGHSSGLLAKRQKVAETLEFTGF